MVGCECFVFVLKLGRIGLMRIILLLIGWVVLWCRCVNW